MTIRVVFIGVLGPLEIGAAGPLSPRDRVIVEALVVHAGRSVAPDRLADALWGETPPASWAKVIQGSIMRLRQQLGASTIETLSDGYRLSVESSDIDVHQFEQLVGRARSLEALGDHERTATTLERALALWRGDAFSDLDRWQPAPAEAARLEALRRSAEEALLDARINAGDRLGAVADGEALVTAEPLSERRWALLAHALYQAGRQGDALRAVQRARRVLAEELGVGPGPELLALEQRLLQQDPTLVTTAAELPTPAARCPYRGLVPYDVDDDETYFGRDREVETCLRRLTTSSFVAVVGPSGSGKSSLVRAGVASRVRRSSRPCVVITPGNDPRGALAGALATANDRTVLVVDQLEELVAPGIPAEIVTDFLDRLLERLAIAPVGIALRADHVGSFTTHPAFARRLEAGLHLVTPMTDVELRAAIEGPAAVAGLRLEAGLVELLLRDVHGEPGGLPLLSFAVAETWSNRDGRVLTVDGYLATGGLRQAIATSAERLYNALPSGHRPLARALFLRLVTPGADGDVVRQRVDEQRVSVDDNHQRVVDAFVRTRLVVAGSDGLEIAHEALVREWPRLRSWLDEDQDGQRLLRHLAAAAASWNAMGTPDSELYRGTRLAQATDWRQRTNPDLSRAEQTFLDASQALATAEHHSAEEQVRLRARQNRRLKVLLAGTAAALVVALLAGGLAVVQSRRADDQRDEAAAAARQSSLRALVGDAIAVRDTDRDLAALLALEAYRLDPGPASRSALFGTFTGDAGFVGYLPVPDANAGLMAGVALPDDERALVVDNDGVVHELDIADFTATGRRFPDPGVGEVFFSRLARSDDGSVVAQIVAGSDVGFVSGAQCDDPAGCNKELPGGDDWLAVYDVPSATLRFPPIQLDYNVGDVAVSPDGQWVVAAGGERAEAVVYRADTGQEVGRVSGLDRPPNSPLRFNTAAVAFDRSGRLYLSSEAGSIRIIDPSTQAERGRLPAPPEQGGTPYLLRISADGSTLIGVSEFGTRAAWDVASRELRWSHGVDPEEFGPSLTDLTCNSMAVAAQHNAIFCGDQNGGVVKFDLDTGERAGQRLDLQQGAVIDLVVTANEQTLIEVGSAHSVLGVWRIDGSGPIARIVASGNVPGGYSPDGRLLLVAERSAGLPGAWDVWDPSTDTLVDPLDGFLYPWWTGNSAQILAPSADGAGGVYDITTDQRIWESPASDGFGYAVVDRANNRLFIQLSDDRRGLIDLGTGDTVEPPLPEGPSTAAAFSGDGLHLAIAELDGITIYDATTGNVITGPRDLGFDRMAMTNAMLVGLGDGGELFFHDLLTLQPLGAPLQASNGFIERLEFSADDSLMMSSGGDRLARLFDLGSRTQLGDAIQLPREDVGATLRPDGRELAADSAEGVALWDLDPANWTQAACRVAGRNLTEEEWLTYVGEIAPYHETCPVAV